MTPSPQQDGKAVPSTVELGQPPDISAKLDELGPLKAKVKELRKLQERVSNLQNEILALIGEWPADQPKTIESLLNVAEISAREMASEIDKQGIFALVGQEQFLAKCDLTQERLKELRPNDWQKFITKTQTGSRRFTVIAKTAVVPRKPAKSAKRAARKVAA